MNPHLVLVPKLNAKARRDTPLEVSTNAASRHSYQTQDAPSPQPRHANPKNVSSSNHHVPLDLGSNGATH